MPLIPDLEMEDFSLEEYKDLEKVMADENKLIEESMKKARKYINEQSAAGTLAKNNEAEVLRHPNK